MAGSGRYTSAPKSKQHEKQGVARLPAFPAHACARHGIEAGARVHASCSVPGVGPVGGRGRLARGIRLAIESDAARNEDFNLSTATSTTVRELAEVVWRKIKGDAPLRFVSDEPFAYDVQRRVPDVRKAKDVLGFEATTSLDDALDEIIPWIEQQIELGGI